MPTRLHHQLTKLQKTNPDYSGKVIDAGHPTTQASKKVETAKFNSYFKANNGKIPEVNSKSYKGPKIDCGA